MTSAFSISRNALRHRRLSPLLALPALILLTGISECAPATDEDGDGWTPEEGDCDDQDASTWPGALELCDGIDNDCNGTIDDGPAGTWYYDADGDGFGDPARVSQASCPPTGYIGRAGDCDDSQEEVNPGALETCDLRDNNCDGAIDEGFEGSERWYADKDGDGYGDPADVQCGPASPGYVGNDDDCYDYNDTAYPGAVTYGATHRGDGSWDYNCNGEIEYAIDEPLGSCDPYSCMHIYGLAWTPACGQSPTYIVGCEWYSPTPGYPGAGCMEVLMTAYWPQTCN